MVYDNATMLDAPENSVVDTHKYRCISTLTTAFLVLSWPSGGHYVCLVTAYLFDGILTLFKINFQYYGIWSGVCENPKLSHVTGSLL